MPEGESPPPPAPPALPRPREWAVRLLLVLLSAGLVLGFAEVAARIVQSRQQGGKEGREEALYMEYDPLLGWRKRKNAVLTYRRREYTVEVRINALGLRDPERALDPPPGTFRVLAVGDSFLEGYTVDLKDTVTQRLERRLRQSGCPAEVINGGTSAYSTDQEYLFYRSDGARYRPSLVLLFFYWNDVIYSDRQDYFGAPKPAFEMGGGRLRLHRYPVKEKPREEDPGPKDESPDRVHGSALLALIRERLWVGAPELHDRLAGLGLWNPIPKVPPRQEMLVYDQRNLAPVEDAWEKVQAIVKAFKENVEDHGSQLAIVYVPGRMEIQQASWQATRQMYRLKEGAWRLTKVRDQVFALGGSLGLPVIDTGPALREAEDPLRSTYFRFDGHWNARGHEAAARAVFDWMTKTGALPKACGGTLPFAASSGGVALPEMSEAR